MKILKLTIAILIPLLAGFLGSYFTTPAISTWYVDIIKPELNPPNWIFAPVWTTLYILMGVSFYLILEKRKNLLPILIFGIQIILNTTWSFLFFGIQRLDLAFANIILLWISILVMIIIFYRLSKISGYLLFPYIIWVTFAGYLNYAIWMLN